MTSRELADAINALVGERILLTMLAHTDCAPELIFKQQERCEVAIRKVADGLRDLDQRVGVYFDPEK